MKLNVNAVRRAFPVLSARYRKQPVIYFDNACMSLKPLQVTEAMNRYYHTHPGCPGRSAHLYSNLTTREVDRARRKFQRFFNASAPEEIIFLRNATEGINLLAHSLDFNSGDAVITSDLEHNSNLVPWQFLKKRKGIRLVQVQSAPGGTFDLQEFARVMSRQVRLVSVLHSSNVTGVSFPVNRIIEIAREHGSLVCLDAAQSALYQPIDVKKLDVDFLVASAHKLMGPTGVGVLYGRRSLLEEMEPFLTGGQTVTDVNGGSVAMAGLPNKYEAGLQDYAGIIGAGAAIDFIESLGRKKIHAYLTELNACASAKLKQIKGLEILGPEEPEKRGGICNFTIRGVNMHELGRLLNDSYNIMARPGKLCAHNWYNRNRIEDSLRFSFGPYNTCAEIALAVAAVNDIRDNFFSKAG